MGGSFRDPSGFVFIQNKTLYRQVNLCYRKEYDKLVGSELYQELTNKRWLICHTEIGEPVADAGIAYKTIAPEPLPFISYPYEWSFSQLRDAGLLTLKIARAALEKGMILKDASAYNIQFIDGKPILIDTLSFAIYREGAPWEAYRQFCQHFLAPLALAALVDIRLIQLLRVYIDGIPLDLASNLLPKRTRLGLSGIALHIHLHAKTQKQFAAIPESIPTGIKLSRHALLHLLDGLEHTIQNLTWEPKGTEWGDYYNATNYSDESLKLKGILVGQYIDIVKPSITIDLGANNGLFSRESSKRDIQTIASDIDPAAVEMNYQTIKKTGEGKLLPLLIDLSNPSGGIGWANEERDSLTLRGPFDLVMALALIHHLAISNNIPLTSIAHFFGILGKWAIVEFVPKNDSQVKRLLFSRKDIFDKYSVEGFEEAFTQVFTVERKESIPGTNRFLYLFKRK